MIYDKNFTIGAVDDRMYSSFVEHLGRCVYDGLYQPGHPSADEYGFRQDVKDIIRELGVSGIRYPGGNFVSGYHWRDGIGPKKDRPVRKDMAWNVRETNEVGTNEFLRFAGDCGAQVYMTVNLGTGTPSEAAELVEYCNVESGTAVSDLRREHGVPHAYGIGLWYLGNEMDGEWQIQMHTAQEYARKAKETAKMMKWIDPYIELVACGSCTNETGHRTFGDWDLRVLEECYEYIEYLSIHRYYNYRPGKQMFYPMHEDAGDIPFIFRDMQDYLDTMISVCDFVKGKRHSQKTIYLSVDEWGLIAETGAIPGGQSQNYGYASYNQMDAVIYGGLLCTFLNYADRVKIACQSLLVNESGMITTSPEGKAIRQTTSYVFQDAAKYGHGTVLRGVTDFPKRETTHHGPQETVQTACVYDRESGALTIFAINCDLEEDVLLELDFRAVGSLKGLGRRELYDDDPWAGNTFDEEHRVAPQEEALGDCSDGMAQVLLKKHSWNVMRYQVTGAVRIANDEQNCEEGRVMK